MGCLCRNSPQLIILNMHPNTTETELYIAFDKLAETSDMVDVNLLCDIKTGLSLRQATITFRTPTHAESAFHAWRTAPRAYPLHAGVVVLRDCCPLLDDVPEVSLDG